MNTKTISTIAVLTSMSIASFAQAQHADLLLIRDAAGNLLTGQYDFDSGQVVNTGTRVYEGEFDAFGTSDEPGFNALSSSNIPTGFQSLAGNTAVSFDANSFQVGSASANLYYWDGQGEVNFTAATNSLTISKAPSAIFSALLDGSDSDVDGFDIATTSSDGFLHKHIDFGLSDICRVPMGSTSGRFHSSPQAPSLTQHSSFMALVSKMRKHTRPQSTGLARISCRLQVLWRCCSDSRSVEYLADDKRIKSH